MTELAPVRHAAAARRPRGPGAAAGPPGAPCRTPRCASSTRTTSRCPRGEVGEIAVRGGNVMLGYWNRPEETAAALRGGWMHTGDGGHMDDDGYVFIVDRIKDMIITGGENVYSAEVENALAQHPAVATCAVIGVPDETWGERVHAVVVPVAGRQPSPRGTDATSAASASPATRRRASMEIVEALPLSARRQGAQARAAQAVLGGPDRAVH